MISIKDDDAVYGLTEEDDAIQAGASAIERRTSPAGAPKPLRPPSGDDAGGGGAAAAGLAITRTGLVQIVVQNWRKEVSLFCGELVQRNRSITIYKVCMCVCVGGGWNASRQHRQLLDPLRSRPLHAYCTVLTLKHIVRAPGQGWASEEQE
jgi:hypothetical protein